MDFTETEKRWLMESGKISRQHIFQWEHGGGISLKFLPLVARVKGVSIDALVQTLIDEKLTANG